MSFASHDLSSEIHPHEKVTKRSILLNKRLDDWSRRKVPEHLSKGQYSLLQACEVLTG